LAINPSALEFLDKKGQLLAGVQRRLATLESLQVDSYDGLGRDHGDQILDDCAAYFHRRPYNNWFGRLDPVLKDGLGVSYYEDTACHLDLVQWATDPYWNRLETDTRANLLKQDRDFLVQQLRNESYKVIVVNGRTALNEVERAGIVAWEPIGVIDERPRTELYRAETEGAVFIGWSCNIPNQQGASRHLPALAQALREQVGGLVS
jgi:hypothetical protein